MKKLIIVLMAVAVFASCKKDSDGPGLGDVTISFDQSTISVAFEADDDQNKSVLFDVVLDKVAPEHVSASLSILTSSTVSEGTHFLIDSKELAISKDAISTEVEVDILSNGVNGGDSLILNISLSSGVVQVGENNQLTIIIKRAQGANEPVTILNEGFEGGEIPTG